METSLNMKLKLNKYTRIKYDRNDEFKNSYNYMSPNFADIITQTDEARVLGVIMNSNGNYSSHI